MYEKEKIIREQRTIEATKKGFMGLDGKLGCILRFLGKPIISEDTSWFASNEAEDFYSHLDEEEEGAIPEADLDTEPNHIGWYFDGLSRGMHLEIMYRDARRDRDEGMIFNELSASWEGYSVYREIAGELYQYVPRPEWEKCVERLYVLAKKNETVARRQGLLEDKIEHVREKSNFLDTLKKLWGI